MLKQTLRLNCLGLAIAILLATARMGFAQDQTELPIHSTGLPVPALESLDQQMMQAIKQAELRGGALAVAQAGRLIFARGYGLQADGATVQPDTPFRIAGLAHSIGAPELAQQIQEKGADWSAHTSAQLLGREPAEAFAEADPLATVVFNAEPQPGLAWVAIFIGEPADQHAFVTQVESALNQALSQADELPTDDQFPLYPTPDNEPRAERMPLAATLSAAPQYSEFPATVSTRTSSNIYSGLSCQVRVYSSSLYLYVQRRLFNGQYTPSPKSGDVGIIDTSQWRVIGSTQSSITWRLDSQGTAAGSVWLATGYRTPMQFYFQAGTTLTLSVSGGRRVITVQGNASGIYTTSVTQTITF